MSIFFSSLRIVWFGIEGQTLDRVIFFAELINLRIGIVCSFIEIVSDFPRSVSRISLLERKMQKRLFEILDTYIMSFGDISFAISRMYSTWRMPSMELKTNACSLDGVFSFEVMVAKLGV